MSVSSPLPVGSLPGIPATGPPNIPPVNPGPVPTQTQSGNAAGLFPTLSPSPSSTSQAGARKVADTSASPHGASVVGAQLVGLAALALAFVLAVTRLSIRRPAKQAATDSGPDAAGNRDGPTA